MNDKATLKTIRYAQRLIGFDTTSKLSNRLITKYLELKLTKHGFVVEKVDYLDERNTRKTNLIAKKGGGQGGLAYFGHSDVVPAKKWFTEKFGPFEPTITQERLYGRGACDMKGSIACMLTASQMFAWDELEQPLYLCITADEEVGFHGARCVVQESELYREMVQHQTKAIIGEPTSLQVVYAHKGSAELTAISRGVAAHSSSRDGLNSNLAMIPFLNEVKKIYDETENDPKWQNPKFNPPTFSVNILIKDDARALNVKPALSTCTIYLRTMPEVDEGALFSRIQSAADQFGVEITIRRLGGIFMTNPDSDFVQQSLKLAHRHAAETVAYGTDGGILTELNEKIVFGPGSIAQAHTHDEWISLEQLKLGTEMYAKMIQHWCCRK